MISLSNKTKGFFCFAFNRKMPLGKVPFLNTLFLKNEEQPSENNYRAMFFSQEEGHMQKFSWFGAKNKTTKIVTYLLLSLASSFYYRTIGLWNNLDPFLKSSRSVQVFIHILKNKLLDNFVNTSGTSVIFSIFIDCKL